MENKYLKQICLVKLNQKNPLAVKLNSILVDVELNALKELKIRGEEYFK